jgi:hypothetical protein
MPVDDLSISLHDYGYIISKGNTRIKPMQLNIILEEEEVTKLSTIQKITGKDLTDVLRTAIDRYHQQVNEATAQKSPLQIFAELGLVGCFEGEPDLSVNYKSVVKSYVLQKHDHC